ncbi:ComEC/Rec2 family competence protein [Flavobacterium degerlachei]|jgi:beta-lactamase superfamily II metal-dependent hydrolase|uniref:Metallo-beta-lactamase superfamily protein n=1 Tax=Flavobacterium degerlachei TaxID=229203 RepID=A0A1H3CF43_9FLAO|nr:MBL fold metallo-hydrolase [Flavobacterium degerlachei]SDX52812.1 Metallo-beta-lactamase superfamily protein [Flavobacterium degerlachei]
MRYEIEMLNVGNADAIILRYFNNEGHEYVVVIDAGNKKDGIKVAEQINAFTNQKYIDLAICSHPDSDHIGGFFYLVENIRIDEFWIHDPAKHVDISEIRKSISLAKLTKSMSKITESIDNNINLLEVIRRKGISHKEPFTGVNHNQIPLTVLGPSILFYESLIKNFRDVKQLFEEENRLEYDDKEVYENDIEYLFESLSLTLDEDDDKSSENNSSTIIAFHPENNKKYLFTADTGPMALQEVVDNNFEWTKNLDWLDVPHHGSKKNLNSSLIHHFSPKVAFISGKGKRKYPSQAVVKALKKVGTLVYSTSKSNSNIIHKEGFDFRPGYETAQQY